MKLLVIAPSHPDLPNAATEAAAVVNANRGSYLVQGAVDERAVATGFNKGPFDAIWIASHAAHNPATDDDEIMLTSGTLGAEALIPYLRASRARLIMLNTCASATLAVQINNATGAAVVATLRAVPDVTAWRTGALFAQHLATSQDPQTAYEAAKPGNNKTYIFLPARPFDPPQPATPPPQPATPRKRGAQPKNTNAVKHGLYARNFRTDELTDLDAATKAGLDEEIAMMRVLMARVLDLANQEDATLDTMQNLLGSLGVAATRLSGLLKTQKLLAGDHAEIANAITAAIAAVVKEFCLA